MKRWHSIVLVLILIAYSSAVAQDSEPRRPKSSAMGTSLSLVGTLAPAAVGFAVIWGGAEHDNLTVGVTGVTLMVGGAIFGPGSGHLYAGNARRFWTGAGLRTLGLGAFVTTGLIGYSETALSDEGSPWEFGAVVAITLTGISMIYDIATVDESVAGYNCKHDPGKLSVLPTFDLDRGGAGVKLSWQF